MAALITVSLPHRTLAPHGLCLGVGAIIGWLLATGCAGFPSLTENQYLSHFQWQSPPEGNATNPNAKPLLLSIDMAGHNETVSSEVARGHRVIGEASFQTAQAPENSHLLRAAESVGGELVVFSTRFVGKEQELVNQPEWIPGEVYSAKGVTIRTRGRWINQVEVVNHYYYEYRATFLRLKESP